MENPGNLRLADAVALWRSMRDYLRVEIPRDAFQTNPRRGGREERYRVATVAVTNVAPTGPDWPFIVFEAVELLSSMGRSAELTKPTYYVGSQPTTRINGLQEPVLYPGQSLVYELSFRD
ncbi:MAG: hypothetical protein Q8O40_03380 [Chloroflexota bacterium]|nr:hypothetical protein [Chloroflexota bacterium]